MVLYISTGYRVLGIVCLDQLKGSRHTHILYHNIRTVPGQVQHSIGRVIKWWSKNQTDYFLWSKIS